MATRPYPTQGAGTPATRVALAGVVAVLLATGAAACGSPSGRAAVSAPILLQETGAALGGVSAVHLSGTVTSKTSSGTDTVTVDATSAGASGTAQGTLELVGPGLGFSGSTRYITIGGTTYVNAGSVFWKSLFGQQTATATKLEGEVLPKVVDRWVSLPAASTDTLYKDALGLSEPKAFLAGTLTSAKGTLSNAGNQSFGGVSGVQISSSTGIKILVASTGPALPLAVADSTAKSTGSFQMGLTISYPGGVTVTAPAQPVSLSAIEASIENAGG